MIIGTGNVGTSIAYALINQRTSVNDLVLVDINTQDAEGEAMDLSDALATSPSFMKIRAGDYREAEDCDICVITAGANQKVGETRTALLTKNAKIIRSIVEQMMKNHFNGIFIVVANPMDTLTYLAQKYSNLPPERVLGSGTILDSARLRFALSEHLKIHPKSVHAYQIGEHGDSEFALWSTANAGGEKISSIIRASELSKIEESVRQKAYEIINRKGATFYGIGNATVQIINTILNDERRILAVSNYDDCAEIYYGFPAIIGRQGVIRRIELPLTETEGVNLQKSINKIRDTIATLDHAK